MTYNALVTCNHCPQPQGTAGYLAFCLQFPALNPNTVGTAS